MAEGQKRPVIDKEDCTGCTICVDECPKNVLEIVNDVAKQVRPDDCDGCGNCAEICPNEAIKMQ